MRICKLRKMKETDLEMVLNWRNEEKVRMNMYSNEIIKLDTHLEWYKTCDSDSSKLNFIFEKEGQPLGVVSFTNICLKNQRASWAFYSGDLSVKGIGILMEILALEYAFDVLKLNKLSCEVLAFNQSVIKFHKKFGFEEEGLLRNHYWRAGRAYDIHLMALFKDKWPSTKSKYFIIFKKELGE